MKFVENQDFCGGSRIRTHINNNFPDSQQAPETVSYTHLKMIIDGEMDAYPENAFFNVGTIDDVIAKAKEMEEE